MAEYISREEVLDNAEYTENFNLVVPVRLIKAIPTADVQPVDRWIGVDERLPDNDNEVLVWYEYFRYGEYNCMYQTYGLARYVQRYDMWSGEDLNGTAVKVLYWQPLPEPPKES